MAMFVRNCWYVASWSHELEERALMARVIVDEPVVLYRTSDGRIVCMEDRCRHRFAPLSKGRLEGDDLRCLYHGLKFNSAGVCVEIPGQDMIPRNACVRTFPAVEKHSWIWVWMGDPVAADEDLIPPAVGLDHPDWELRSAHIDYEANYLLINDNLTDFTHLSYVHANSFGATEAFARTRPKVERLPRGIRVSRWVKDAVKPGAEIARIRPPAAELWQSYDFLAPGVLLMHSVSCPEGTMARFGGERPDLTQVEVIADQFTSQAVTPMTDRTARYYFSWGPRAGDGAAATADGMIALARKAFAEDKDIIEAQQRIIDFDPDRREMLTSADVGPMQMRAVIRELAAQEDAPPTAVASA